jgi:hypothetical protein
MTLLPSFSKEPLVTLRHRFCFLRWQDSSLEWHLPPQEKVKLA